jgi:fatty acid-binding protein DegV
LLNIKPMLMVDDGVLKPVGRERGRRSAKAALIELALARVGDQPLCVSPWPIPTCWKKRKPSSRRCARP